MQTLNILDNHFSSFNAMRVFDSIAFDNNKGGLVLLEQLQTSLELEKLLNIFAMEAAKYVDFSGLSFHSGTIKQAIRGSRKAKIERKFELKINDKFVGILTYAINSTISLTNYKILNELHQFLVYPLNNAILYHNAMQLALQDSLTGLGNRRYFDEQLKRAMHHANRHQYNVGMIVCDLDKFKLINDTYGHHIGDQVLTHFADALRSSIRDSDSIFRFGGDEFTILVENASEQSLNIIHSRINLAVNNDVLLSKYKVKCSLGLTFMNDGDSEQSFFERADKSLYQAKTLYPSMLSIV